MNEERDANNYNFESRLTLRATSLTFRGRVMRNFRSGKEDLKGCTSIYDLKATDVEIQQGRIK